MKRTIVLALVIAGITTSAHAAPITTRPACSKHFTVWMAKRGISHAWRGTRDVTQHDRNKVNWYIRCQWKPRHQQMLRGYRETVIKAWKYRRSLPVFSDAYVSYYDDSGTHCCGVYATYGVAVCGSTGVCVSQGTKIEFCDQRCVVATADDHGPYVSGRDFDLNENTADAIGFGGLGTVKYRIMR